MKLSQFDFKLPEGQIALEPTYHRDECRLMVIHRKSGRIEMTKKDEEGKDLLDEEGNPVYLDFRNILDYFDEDDTFIFNDTKVFPARLYGTPEEGEMTGVTFMNPHYYDPKPPVTVAAADDGKKKKKFSLFGKGA